MDGQLSATILHVSDTQFGRYHRFDPSDSLAGYLIRDVEKLLRDDVPPIDLMIVSGDIAERGKRPEYDQARTFIDQVGRAFGLGHDRVVVVPGNHDMSWNPLPGSLCGVGRRARRRGSAAAIRA
jgi:3',5'-cyclic AMP phosphodiesterase CpdA